MSVNLNSDVFSFEILQRSIMETLGSEIQRVGSITDEAEQSKEKAKLLAQVQRLDMIAAKTRVAICSAISLVQAIRIVPEEENLQFVDGFKTGLGWKNLYRPGGPFIYDEPQSYLNHKAWMKGFDKGVLDSKPIVEKLQQELGLKVE